MNSFKFQDTGSEKGNAKSKHGRAHRLTILFRFLELFIFLSTVSRFSAQLGFSLNLPGGGFRRLSAALISPRFVFLVGNAIVAVLLMISGRFTPEQGEKSADFYNECAGRSPRNRPKIRVEKRKDLSACRHGVVDGERRMSRCRSEINVRAAKRGQEVPLDLRRSAGGECQKSCGVGERMAADGGGCSYSEDGMSSEEFRRTVEAFIARQQRILRE